MNSPLLFPPSFVVVLMTLPCLAGIVPQSSSESSLSAKSKEIERLKMLMVGREKAFEDIKGKLEAEVQEKKVGSSSHSISCWGEKERKRKEKKRKESYYIHKWAVSLCARVYGWMYAGRSSRDARVV